MKIRYIKEEIKMNTFGYMEKSMLITWITLLVCFDPAVASSRGQAEDCVVYEGTYPAMTMHQTMSTGVQQKRDQFAASLSLISHDSEESCKVNIMQGVVAVGCSSGMRLFNWSHDIFKARDITELWVHVGSLLQESNRSRLGDEDSSTDLVIVGRRGVHRGHIRFPSSGLTPPITVHWEQVQPMAYYYNCVSGCLITKTGVTPPGIHSIYFRPEEGFDSLLITYNSTENRRDSEFSLNASHVDVDGQWRTLKVVWNTEGGIGVLVDGNPIGDLVSYTNLNEKSGIEAEVRGDGGHIRLCDISFKEVADRTPTRQEKVLRTSYASQSVQTEEDPAASSINTNWLVIVALVCIGLLLLTSIVLLVLLLRTKKSLQISKDAAEGNDIAVVSFAGSRMSPSKSPETLYTGVLGHDSLQASRECSKGHGPSVPSSNANHITYSGLKT